MEKTILKVSGLTKTYGNKNANDNVNMEIKKGDIYGFIGRNGAGKTTLIKMVVGLISPTSGKIELFENDNLHNDRKKIGTVIEAPAYVPHLSAWQNMYVQWTLLGGKDKSVIDETLKLVGLSDVGKKKVKKFSLGMKQRLAIAMTLMGDPEFLILDEPTNGLDPEAIVEIRHLLQKLVKERGLTILISSHILGELSKLATRYGIINDGKIIEEFTEKELQERCNSGLLINTDDSEAAAKVIKEQLNTENYNIINENEIELFDYIDEPGMVNKTLSKADIAVNSIACKKIDLEEYFLNLIGGKK